MNRSDEFKLNKEVKDLLKSKGVTNPEAVITGYKLGHKYLDHGIADALPTIVEKIVEAEEPSYRVVSRMVYKVIPTAPVEKPVDVFAGRYTDNPLNELLKGFKVKR